MLATPLNVRKTYHHTFEILLEEPLEALIGKQH